MRQIIAGLVCLLALVHVQAQRYEDVNDPKEVKSLLSKNNQVEGFGGIDLKISDIVGERTLLAGGYGGVIINRSYFLGIAAYGLATQPSLDGIVPGTNTEKPLTLYGGYGGIVVGGTILGREIIHISLPVTFGAGNLDVSDDDFFDQGLGGGSQFTVENSTFFVIEPAAQLEFNITSYLRIATGVSYRWVTGLELVNVSNDDMTGITGVLSVRIGRF